MNNEQRTTLLEEWSGPPYDPALTRDELLHELFEATVDEHPDKTAVECVERRVTYIEMERRANRLARLLRDAGVGPERAVALMLPRSERVYEVMLGVLKAGGAYVPLDPDYPADRVGFILQDSSARCLITDRATRERLGAETGETPVLLLDDIDSRTPSQADTRLSRADTGAVRENLCYIIYTSGTTGRPKGVLIEHRNVCTLVRSESVVYGARESDKVFQCASAAFDASVEEIWMAFFHGATLMVGTKEILRSGADFAGILARAGVTVLSCVPTLLSMVEGDIPTLRVLIVGGEACPKDLAARWHRPGRTIFNSYGPTEATVVATVAVLEPNRPVTIGRAIPNYRAYILDDRLEMVPPGVEGELFVAGDGVARGYLHRDDLTREKFLTVDKLTGEPERLYRTGDLVRFNDRGDIEYLGRADDQVKLRGYRVELSEIESVLMQCPGVLAASVALHKDTQQLAAYVVPRAGLAIHRALLKETLKARLPLFMVPAYLDELETLPLMVSGKVDRRRLPAPVTPFEDEKKEMVAPRDDREKAVAAVWAAVFGRASVSVTDDFFLDLGGHSLLAASTTSKLRLQKGFESISVADVYAHPTVEGLAATAVDRGPATAPEAERAERRAEARVPPLRHFLCGLAQIPSLVFVAALYIWQWLGPFFAYAYFILDERPLWYAVLGALVVYSATLPILVPFSIVAKWALLGRIRPGKHKLWGFYYWRFWFARAIVRSVPVKYMAGTPLLGFYYRLMGARVGKSVYLGNHSVTTFDLLTVGDGTSIGGDASLDGSWIEDGHLHLAPVTVGKNCAVGNRSVMGGHVVMEDGSSLGDLSMLPEGSTVPSGEHWEGSPARRVRGYAPPEARPCWNFAWGALFAAGVYLFPLVCEAAVFPGLVAITYLDFMDKGYWFLLAAPMVAVSFILCICVAVAFFKWLVLGKIREGRRPVMSWFYYRKWLLDQLLQMSLEITGTLYSTIYVKTWLRLLGAKVGKRSEISTVRFLQPDLLVAGDECFLADEVSVGAPTVEGGWIHVGYTHVGNRTFVGNSAVLPPGAVLGDNVLIGVLSTTPAQMPVPDGTSWLGSPAILLPRREKGTRFADEQIFRPSRRLRAIRASIEFFRVILPSTFFVVLATLIMNVTDMYQETIPVWVQVALLPVLYLAASAAALAITVAFKFLVVGRYREAQWPLWSVSVWRSELSTGIYENFAVLFFLDLLRGTPLMAWALRCLGTKIGRRCYIDTSWFTEFDLITMGDEAAMNENANVQTHLFEDRVMKLGPVHIGKGCTIGTESTILYNTRIEDGTSLGDLSLQMKGEDLPPGTRWHGIPASRVCR